DGWHSIEIRVSNNGGAAGAAARNNFINGTNIISGYGLGIASNGSTAADGLSYVQPLDNGTMNLFRTPVAAVAPYTLAKSGPGTLTLSGTNTYSGGTTVSGGNLVFAGTGSALSTSSVTVASSGTLTLDNSTTNLADRLANTAAVTLSGGTLRFVGNSSVASTETVGPLVLAANTASTIRTDYGGVAGQVLAFTAGTGSVLTRNTGATLNLVSDNDFLVGTNEILLLATGTATLPVLVGNILPYITVTTFLGQPTEGIDLLTDIDGTLGGSSFSLGRLGTAGSGTAYDTSNVKATSSLLVGASINALLIDGDNITLTVPVASMLTSGQIVARSGATGNTISGSSFDFGTAEPLFFTQGAKEVQQLNLNGNTTGQISLTFVLNTAPAPVLGATQTAAATLQTTAALNIATLTAAGLRQALEALPGIGPGNVAVTLAAGIFTITFIGALAGGNMPALIVNNVSGLATPPTIARLAQGGGTLTVSSAVIGSSQSRKERKGTLSLGGSSTGYTGAIVVNEGEIVVTHVNGLGAVSSGTTVNSGAALTYNLAGTQTAAAEPLNLSGTGYLNGDTGVLRVVGGGTTTQAATITNGALNTTVWVDPATTLILSGSLTNANQNFIKEGTGTLEFASSGKAGGGNGMFVNMGTLRLNLSSTNTVNSHFFIGRNDGGLGAAQVIYASTGGTDQIVAGANVTINRSGLFDFAGRSDTFTSFNITDGSVINSVGGGTITVTSGLTMQGGSINTGTGTLVTTGNMTVNSFGTQATIAGNLSLGNAQRTLTVNEGPSLYDVIISANITGGGTSGRFDKSGAGGLNLTGINNALTGSSEVQTVQVPNAVTSFTLSFAGATTPPISNSPIPSAAAIQAALEALPSIGLGNVAVASSGTTTITYTLTFKNWLGGADLPQLVGTESGGTITSATTTNGVWAFTEITTAGALGIGTDVPWAGGLAMNLGSLFAEGGPRTIPYYHINGAVTDVLGGRRDYGGNNPLLISGGILFAAANQTIQVDDPLTSVQIGGLNAQQLIFFTTPPTGAQNWQITYTTPGGVSSSTPASGPGSLTGSSTALDVQNALNALSDISAGGGSVAVTAGPGAYSFKVVFNGGPLANSDQRLLALGGSGTGSVILQARGGGSVGEGAALANLVKTGLGTLTLASSNTYSGSTSVNAGILRIKDAGALGQTTGATNSGTSVASGAALQI
ncbi:MAG TPA: autotransporter-associated beta strand repeat-containing protein, partial [Chthoniobacteraceae bacterium]|nr:autotransporter-associated beta strand repeat-containing protein [Chthoniobacteraceae bacterium]